MCQTIFELCRLGVANFFAVHGILNVLSHKRKYNLKNYNLCKNSIKFIRLYTVHVCILTFFLLFMSNLHDLSDNIKAE